MGLFSGPSQKDILRQQQKDLRGTNRDLDREVRNLALQEQKLEAEIKVVAKKGHETAARILAKQLIEVRQQKQRLMVMKSQVSSSSVQTKQVQTQNLMAKSLAATTSAMRMSNQQMNPAQSLALLRNYEKEAYKMEMGSEIVNDAFDSVYDGNEEAEDEIVEKVFDEIGLEFKESMASTAGASSVVKESAGSKVSDADVERFLAEFEQ